MEIVGGFLNFRLHEAGLDGFEHAAGGVDFFYVGEGAGFDFVGKRFDGVGARDGIDGVGDSSFVGDDLLGPKRDECGVFGGKRKSLVQ